MPSPAPESATPLNLFEEDFSELVDYESDTKLPGEEESKPSTPVRTDDSRRAPNPFPEREAGSTLASMRLAPAASAAIITNPLDEHQ